MSGGILRFPWTRQPQVPVGIDWSNPLSRGLVFLANYGESGSSGRNLVSGLRGTQIGTPAGKAAGPQGVSTDWTNGGTATSEIFTRTDGLSPSVGVTVGYFGRRTASPVSYCRPIAVTHSSGTLPPYISYGVGINDAGSGADFVSASIGTGSGGYLASTPVSAPTSLTQPHVLLGAWDTTSNLISVYHNDKLLQTKATTGSLVYSSAATGPLIVSGSHPSTVANNFCGDIYCAFVWDRKLSASEVKSLYNNPWQLFQPIQRTIWVPAAGGGAFTPAITEAAAATSAQSAALAATAALTENTAATDAVSITVGFAASISEIAAALESISAAAAMAATIIENASASSAEAAAMSASATYTDNASGTDTVDAAGAGGVYGATYTDNAAATDAQSATFGATAILTETAAASSTQSAAISAAASITENAAATDTAAGTAAGAYLATITETAAATSSQAGVAGFSSALTENATASSTQSAAAAFVASIVENATASDSYAVFNAYMASIVEQANATDSLLAVWYDASDDTAYPLVGLVQSYPGDGYAQHYPLEGLAQS